MVEAPRRQGLAVRPRGLTRAALAVLGGRKIGEIPLDAGRELVCLIVANDAKTGLPLGALTAATRIDTEPLSQPRPLGGRDEHDSDREQGDVQPAHHAASLAKARRPESARPERLDLRAKVGEVRLGVERATHDALEQLGRFERSPPAMEVLPQPLPE